MAASKVTVKDNGYNAMMRNIGRSRQGRRLQVGVKSTPDVEQIAAWQEFGTSRLPSRSYLRRWFDSNRPRIEEDLRNIGKRVVRGDTQTRDAMLTELGHRYAGEVQAIILHGISPALAPSTLAGKQRRGEPDTPLVTHSMSIVNSIVAMLDGEVV